MAVAEKLLDITEAYQVGFVLVHEIQGRPCHPFIGLFIHISGVGIPAQDLAEHGGCRMRFFLLLSGFKIKPVLPLSCINNSQTHTPSFSRFSFQETLVPSMAMPAPQAGQILPGARNSSSRSPEQPRLKRLTATAPHSGQRVFTQSEPTKLWK